MNLFRKHRPKTFDDMIGNEAEIQSFKNLLEKENKPHTYLLTGPSGCGKTTLARIAAKQLGADELSLTNLNSANFRGIDSAREIIQQMQYIPISGIRVFIIEELHQTTKDWQEAMLVPLEDTPDHVYFFLCTTTPNKLKEALRNRCTKVNVTSQDDETLYRYMRTIAREEGLEVSKEIIREISENCNGSPRQALVILEKVSEMNSEKSMREVISIGEEAEKEVIELCKALLKGADWGAVAAILKDVKDVDVESIRYAVLGYMNSVLLGKGNYERACKIIEWFEEPLYNSGRAGLTLACYQVINGE